MLGFFISAFSLALTGLPSPWLLLGWSSSAGWPAAGGMAGEGWERMDRRKTKWARGRMGRGPRRQRISARDMDRVGRRSNPLHAQVSPQEWQGVPTRRACGLYKCRSLVRHSKHASCVGNAPADTPKDFFTMRRLLCRWRRASARLQGRKLQFRPGAAGDGLWVLTMRDGRNVVRQLLKGIIKRPRRSTRARGHPGQPDGSQDRASDLFAIHQTRQAWSARVRTRLSSAKRFAVMRSPVPGSIRDAASAKITPWSARFPGASLLGQNHRLPKKATEICGLHGQSRLRSLHCAHEGTAAEDVVVEDVEVVATVARPFFQHPWLVPLQPLAPSYVLPWSIRSASRCELTWMVMGDGFRWDKPCEVDRVGCGVGS